MLDLNNLSHYQENNRIEAKKALGGLPHSIWETYSAFANTLGGVILLGVEEFQDHSLHTVDLPDPERLIREFWGLVNDPEKVSANILSRENVAVEVAEGNHIVVITVPRAQRYDRPVYIGGNPLTGSYRRSGEGDYRCTREEVQSMLRDAAVKTQDTRVLEHLEMDVLDYETVRRYRLRMNDCRPEHAWSALEDTEFLYRIGAADHGSDGTIHPTAAGLLMFGNEYEIVKEFPHYFLDYREQTNPDAPWTDRIVSSSGEWSGNLCDFYFLVCEKFSLSMPETAPEETVSVYDALEEALANCLVNADYHGRSGVVVSREASRITISNPGSFRMDIADAISGGVSDPRNAALIRMFNFIDIGARAGSGIPNIFRVWRRCGWGEPEILEEFSPERIVLSLPLEKETMGMDQASVGNMKRPIKAATQKAMIIEYLTDHISASRAELADGLHMEDGTLYRLLESLQAEGIVVAEGNNRSRSYRLKR